MSVLPPLALYVHLPWCERKCPYCDFNSYHSPGKLPEESYLLALSAELDHLVATSEQRALHSIFIGGGTPSLFSPQAIESLLLSIKSRFALVNAAEITLEANPGSAEAAKFAAYRQAGVNRLSIGIQSFNNASLLKLGRVHNRGEALAAIAAARQAGFDNINLDLMHGLPGQSLTDAEADLEQALEFAPEHLSWYQLTIEPNTAYANQPPTLPDELVLAEIQDCGEAVLKQAGMRRYEISAFAKTGFPSQHNLNYWQFGDYLGIGAGAHDKLTQRSAQGDLKIVRSQNTRSPNDYLAREGRPISNSRTVTAQELPLEFMMNALRLENGVDSRLFKQRTGLTLDTIAPALDKLVGHGLIHPWAQRLQTTDLGYRFLNTVLAEFDLASEEHICSSS